MTDIADHTPARRPWDDEFEARGAAAVAMGGPERLAKRRAAGLLNARERLDALLDPGSFTETGRYAVSVMAGQEATSPADGKVAGYGRIGGRPVAVVSNDFTVKGASSSLTNMKKIGHVKRTATEQGMPIVFLGESSGARMPDNMGAKGMGTMLGNDPQQYVRHRETPWCSAVLGACYGSSAWYTALSDFSVMRKGAVMAVASPQLASMAVGETIDPEDLGGAVFHSETTGLVDRVAETDEEALALVRTFLSYLPAHHNERPPTAPVADGADDRARGMADLLPDSRTRGYDMRKMVQRLVDPGSLFELKPRYGRAIVSGLARLGGETIGIIANNPMVKGGALDVAACEKATKLIVLCDSFNIPLVLMVDTPGFVIGKETERQRGPAKIMTMMTALQLASVPKLSVIVRKTYGQAYLNMGGGRNSSEVAVWPTAEISFMDPHYGTRIVTLGQGLGPGDPQFERIKADMEADSTAWKLAEIFAAQQVIRPEDTRSWLLDMLAVHRLRRTGGISRHAMAAWPWW